MPVPPAPDRRRFARPLAALTVAYALVLVFATHYPRPEELLGAAAPSDKTLHFTAYALLGGLVAATLAAAGRWAGRAPGITIIGLLAFAAIDEATQPAFGRHADWLDWVFDGGGLAAGVAVVAAVLRRRPFS